MDKNDQEVLFYVKVNSVYKKNQQLAHFYITDKAIILTKHSLWNLYSHVGDGLLGYLDGENKPLCNFEISKLKSITRTRFKLNGKCCLFKFEDDEIIIIFDFVKKVLEKIAPLLPGVDINFN